MFGSSIVHKRRVPTYLPVFFGKITNEECKEIEVGRQVKLNIVDICMYYMYVLYNMFCDLGMCQSGRCYVCVSRDTLHNGILYTVMVEASYVSFNGG